jgi:hypothetical protein
MTKEEKKAYTEAMDVVKFLQTNHGIVHLANLLTLDVNRNGQRIYDVILEEMDYLAKKANRV